MCYNFIARDYSRSAVQIRQTQRHTHTCTHVLSVIWWLPSLGRQRVLMNVWRRLGAKVHICAAHPGHVF